MFSALALTLASCNNNDNTPTQPSIDGNLWGTTYYHANLGAYPDIYSKYWVYAYDITGNPNIGLRLTGFYPKARYWSICIGSVMNTYSYCSFYDRMLEYKDGEKITVAVVSANNARVSG